MYEKAATTTLHYCTLAISNRPESITTHHGLTRAAATHVDTETAAVIETKEG